MELISSTVSVRRLLNDLDPAFPRGLFSARVKQRLRLLAPRLPQARCFLFECHLGARRRRVDLSLGGLRSLPPRLDHPALRERVSTVWLEYDLDEARRRPAVFAGVGRKSASDPEVLGALAAGLGLPLPPAAAAALHRCVAATAGGDVWLAHLGVMQGREGCPLRVNVGGRSASALRRFLKAMGACAEASATLDALFRASAAHDPDYILTFDLTEEGPVRPGLECYFPRDEGAWVRMLERLTAERLCSEREADAILAWPGRSVAKSHGRISPLEVFLGVRKDGSFLRALNHIKLSAERPGGFRVKAYLAVFRLPPEPVGVESNDGERTTP